VANLKYSDYVCCYNSVSELWLEDYSAVQEGKVMNCILLCMTNSQYLVLQDQKGLENTGYSHHYKPRYTLPLLQLIGN